MIILPKFLCCCALMVLNELPAVTPLPSLKSELLPSLLSDLYHLLFWLIEAWRMLLSESAAAAASSSC